MDNKDFHKSLAKLESQFESLKPELELTVRDPELNVEGHVVVWNTFASRGGPLGRCGKGGTRITPNVTLEEVGMLSRLMTLKIAAAGLPLGGAKSGLRADPDSPGFEKVYRRFIELVKPVLIENGGVFGGFGFDIGARPEHPRWACEVLGSTKCFTGKPLDMGGTDYDREGIAGLGVAVAAKTIAEVKGEAARGLRFSVQGVGAMGAAVVRYFSEFGGTLCGLADPRIGGAFMLKENASPTLIASIVKQDFAGTSRELASLGSGVREVKDILTEPVDVLFPSAVQDVITGANAAAIRARYVVEGANNPCTAEARSLLFQRGVTVVPDFIANSGGIIAAFIEMTSDISIEENIRSGAKVNQAKDYTRSKITENVKRMQALVEEHEVEPVLAGKYLALSNIFKSPHE